MPVMSLSISRRSNWFSFLDSNLKAAPELSTHVTNMSMTRKKEEIYPRIKEDEYQRISKYQVNRNGINKLINLL